MARLTLLLSLKKLFTRGGAVRLVLLRGEGEEEEAGGCPMDEAGCFK